MTGPDHGIVFDGRPVTPTLGERLRGRWRGTGSFTSGSVVWRAARAGGGGAPRFTLRVDDYPHWATGPEVFARFHAILKAAGIRYLLGAIPRPPVDPAARDDRTRAWTSEERATLADAAADLDVAVHGLTHAAGPGPVPAEIVGRTPDSLAHDLGESLAILGEMGYRPRAYIPPFNAVDRPALAVLARRFPVVCGGPESVRWLGCLPGPCRLDGVWFVPSYPPAYGRAADVLEFVRTVSRRPVRLLIPLTLHWTWEVADGFESVRRLAGTLAASTVTIETWEAGAAWASPGAAPRGGDAATRR